MTTADRIRGIVKEKVKYEPFKSAWYLVFTVYAAIVLSAILIRVY